MKRNRSRYRTQLAKQRRRAGLHFILRSLDIFRPPDQLLTHCELPILEINKTGTR
jgi:hypothetical protein